MNVGFSRSKIFLLPTFHCLKITCSTITKRFSRLYLKMEWTKDSIQKLQSNGAHSHVRAFCTIMFFLSIFGLHAIFHAINESKRGKSCIITGNAYSDQISEGSK